MSTSVAPTTHPATGRGRLLIGLPWYALVPGLISLVVGLRGISSVGYWVDEFYTLNAVKGGLGETLGELPYLPYYTLVWAGSGGGRCLSEGCLRYPSVLAATGAVVVVAATARLLSNRRAGLAAGLMMIMAPGIQRYAQDARPYAVGVLLVSLATLFLVIGMRRDARWPWVLYALAVVGVGLLLPVGLAVLAGHAVLLWDRPLWRAATRRWVLALACCSPVFLLGLWSIAHFAVLKQRVGDVMVIHPQNVLEGATWVTSGGVGDAALYGLFAGALIFAALLSPAGTRWLIAMGASILVIWLVSVGPMLWWQGRSLVPLAGLAVVGAALTFGGLSRPRFVTALVLLALFTLPFYTWNRLPWSRGFDYRQAAQVMSANWEPGDRIDSGILLPWVVQWSLDQYGGGAVRYVETSPPSGRVWRLASQEPCPAVQEWDLGLGNTIRLCPEA